MKRLLPVLFTMISFAGFAQNTINNYKFVIVPEKFSFLKEANQYKLNVLSKNLIADKGFTAYFDNADLPTAIATDKCSALSLDILEHNSMFSTNLTLVLKDCKGNIVFKSKEGKSREKDYEVGYNLALRDAFKSLEAENYSYSPVAGTNNSLNAAAQQAAGTAVAANSATETTSTASSAALNPAANTVTAASTLSAPGAVAAGTEGSTLYAQATATGYQLIDTTPKIRFSLYKTSVANYYIANNGITNGVVFQKDTQWVFECYQNNKLTTQILQIKF